MFEKYIYIEYRVYEMLNKKIHNRIKIITYIYSKIK